MAHEFTACEIFGTRYSALGKRIETSLPHNEIDYARTVISDLNIFQLCGQLDLELEDEEAELDYLIENRKQYYKKHSYMEKKAIGKANDGPVFVGDTLYRRSNGEKYTVQEDGSITNASGKTKLKAPDLDNFIHFFPKKGDRIKNRRKVKPAAITLPKQDNPLVSGPCTKRTPEEAAKAAAKEREQARKEAAKTTEGEKDCETCPSRGNTHSYIKGYEDAKKELCTEAEKKIVKEHYGPKAVAEILPDLTDADFCEVFREEDRRRFGDRRSLYFSLLTDREIVAEASRRGICPIEAGLTAASDAEIIAQVQERGLLDDKDLAGIPTEALKYELEIRGELPPYASLDGFVDKQISDELRRRGYTVTATKTVEI